MRSSITKGRVLKMTVRRSSGRERVTGRYGTRLRLGNYFADIIPDREVPPRIYHWMVQGTGSAKVVHLGQEATFAAALECGHRRLEELVRAHREKHRAIYAFAAARALK